MGREESLGMRGILCQQFVEQVFDLKMARPMTEVLTIQRISLNPHDSDHVLPLLFRGRTAGAIPGKFGKTRILRARGVGPPFEANLRKVHLRAPAHLNLLEWIA